MTNPSKIVVGIDGSAESLGALRWALRAGAEEDRLVEVVHCWKPQTLSDAFLAGARELHAASQCMVQNEVKAALKEFEVPPRVQESSVRGNPSTVLPEHAVGAWALVLGAHGSFALKDVVFGQVAHACSRRAECRVVVVDRVGRATRETPGRLRAGGPASATGG